MRKKNLSLKEAFSHAVEQKKSFSTRTSTHRTLDSIRNLFFKWLPYDFTPKRFDKIKANEFLDWYKSQEISAVSWNNRFAQIHGVFAQMERSGVINVNPFHNIQKLYEPEKEKKCLSEKQVKIISQYLHDNHFWCFISFVLQYYCFVRPAEQRRLRFSDFDLVVGALRIRGEVAKNKKSAWVTIPEQAMPFFRNDAFKNNNINFYVFGKNFKPHPTKTLSDNAMRQAFGRAVQNLQSKGELGNMNGITFYSIKHTGITDMVNDENVSIFETSKQARHKNTEETMKYYHPEKVSKKVKKYNKKLF
ncbi:MAG: hypothetical protein RLZZ628_372 [Bacteroidota bacterium]|jgi:integrase